MKTTDFIAALAADAPKPVMPLGRRITLALVFGAVVSLAFFIAILGPRPDIADAMHTFRFDFKFVNTLALLLPSALLCLRLSRPEVEPGVLLLWVAAPILLLMGALLVELAIVPASLWGARFMGRNWWHCLTLIPLMSIPPLGALIAVLREGAPRHPVLTGALAGAASAGVAATIYGTNCTDDSPIFVASWYPMATSVVVAAGAWAGGRWLRW